jgi:1-acyl-sn-glycerol-3-phosphate acyltransferase
VIARRFGRFVMKRRFDVVEHGTENVPASGPAILVAVLVASHAAAADGSLLGLFGPRPVKAVATAGLRSCLRVLADGHVVGVFPGRERDATTPGRCERGAAYLALVSGAPVVPVTSFGSGPPQADRVEIVYGAPYRPAQQPWPRTRKLVEATALDLRVHLLVALDAARALTMEGPR